MLKTKKEQHIQSFKRVLEYIEENLKSEITLEKISEIANTSKFHFHRLFKERLGESINDYIIRRKLSYAAFQIVDTKRKIEDIAFEINYKSIETFHKAFKKQFDITPAEFRKRNALFTNQVTAPLNLEYYIRETAAFKTIELPAISLIGYNCTGYETPKISVNNMDGVEKYWMFLETLYEHKYPVKEARIYSVYRTKLYEEISKDDFYREWECFMGVIDNSDVPTPELEHYTIPAGKYLYYRFKGTHSEFNKYVNWLWDKEIPELPYNINHDYTFEYSSMGLKGELLDNSGNLDYDKLAQFVNTKNHSGQDYNSPEYITHFFVPYTSEKENNNANTK